MCIYVYMYYMHTSCIEAQNGLAQVIADSEMPCGRSDIPPILRISDGERYLSDLPSRPNRGKPRNRKPITSTTWYERLQTPLAREAGRHTPTHKT